MRYLIIADVHANLEALDAVLAAADGLWDRALLLGDLVGYGASPNEVIERLRGLNPIATIRGNHDKAACGIEDGSNFNYVARVAASWTLDVLTPEHRTYLRELPAGPLPIDDHVEICHGAPFDEDHYIFDADDALRAMAASSRQICLFGHTHLPVVFHYENEMFDGFVPEGDEPTTLTIGANARYLINVGSVGQPRDGDPRAGYGIYDADEMSITMHRVAYPVDGAQRRIIAAGLPASLANRLAAGR
ncbi:MAG TPA: metallophosphoesterase family protein [Vicinamibacterales bacterium]|nr:metallophosphoesterase family protein [Vicinamibacterales bacterium]